MEVAFALVVFVASHVLVARSDLKPWLQRLLGEKGYLAAYSLMPVLLLGWVIVALLGSPRVPVWPAPAWGHGFALVCTLGAFMLMGAGLATPNPLSVSFRKTGYDPSRPGLIGWVRHPILWGFGLWGLAHVPANGDWPSLGLFGGAILFAVLGARPVARRIRAKLGETAFDKLQPGPGHLTVQATLGTLAGALVWAGVLALHPWLFGVDPLAMVFG